MDVRKELQNTKKLLIDYSLEKNIKLSYKDLDPTTRLVVNEVKATIKTATKEETTNPAYKETLVNVSGNVITNYVDTYNNKISDEEMKEIETHTNYIYELMQVIGKKRGALVSGGNTDDEKVARIILDDFRNCKIGKISLEKP